MIQQLNKAFGTLQLRIAVIILTIAAISIPFQTNEIAYASGYISLSTGEGLPGTQVNVSGSGFIADLNLKIYFAAQPASIGNEIDQKVTSYAIVGQAKADYSASFNLTPAFAVPIALNDGKTKVNVTNGDYYIYITYADSKQIQAMATFFVPGNVLVAPNRGRIGDYISITATGLKSNDLVNIYFSSNKGTVGSTIDTNINVYKKVGTFPTKPDGTLGGNIPFQIPPTLTDGPFKEDTHGGDYYIYITYILTRTRVETVSRFTILDGQITLEPATGAVGSEVKISGTGLRANQQITAYYEGDVSVIKNGDTVTDSNGQFSCSITIPESTTGSHQIVVNDVTGNHPEAYFTVAPSISLPAEATVGDEIPIKGFGFSEVQVLKITSNERVISTDPVDLRTNRKGSFTGSFKAPAPAGTVNISATDERLRSGTATLKISDSPSAEAKIRLFPETNQGNPGYVGTLLTVSGSAFQPNSIVTIKYDNTVPVILNNIATDAEGIFQTTLDIPEGKAGNHIIDVSDGQKSVSALFVLEDVSPAPPLPLMPEIVSGVKPTTHFDWTDVTDDSGVTYSFQVAPENSFKEIVFERTKLAQSAYAMKPNESLELKGRQTSYYWRVQAVDGASNASTWTSPVLFYVGAASSAFPTWAIYLLIGLAVAAIIIVGIFVIRLKRNRVKNPT